VNSPDSTCACEEVAGLRLDVSWSVGDELAVLFGTRLR